MLYDLYFTASVWDVDGWMDGGVQKGKMKVKWLVASIDRQADRQTGRRTDTCRSRTTTKLYSTVVIHTYIHTYRIIFCRISSHFPIVQSPYSRIIHIVNSSQGIIPPIGSTCA